MENCMKHEIKIMNAAQLEEANSEAIANNYNRTLNLGKFYESVRKFGYDPRDVNVLKHFNIFVWMLTISVFCVSIFNWTHESCEFSWDDPIEISVFNSLVVFVLLDIE